MSEYDSSYDTMEHIDIVQKIFDRIILPELEKRSENHDFSKLTSPEKETYDKYVPMLKDVKFGTPEYVKIRNKMVEEGTSHHYKFNRHHPEHFENGIKDMTLIDVVEMFVDWYSASVRSDTTFIEGIAFNKKKFNMSDELYQIMLNTYNMYFH